MIKATVIQDSTSLLTGVRLLTFELEYPRFIHGEFMTHRVFSRNAASSRAIPIEKMIEMVKDNPAKPVHWGANQPGMQAKETVFDIARAEVTWNEAAQSAVESALALNDCGLHKQIVNRVLEPFQTMKTVMTTTELDNFMDLRLHEDAQPEIYELARCMNEALSLSQTFLCEADDWHVPYVERTLGPRGNTVYYIMNNDERVILDTEDAIAVSASCCAQVSYRLLDTSLDKALKIYDQLVNSKPIHASPFEHQAHPALGKGFQRNFNSWIQQREYIENPKRIGGKMIDYGPKTRLSQEVHATKYRGEGESFEEAQYRFAGALADNNDHYKAMVEILLNQRFMGGGRTQLAIGSPHQTTAFNCFVSDTVHDSFNSIMDRAKEAGKTMRKGGGVGYGFSHIRPAGSLIRSLGSQASGPISFMRIYDALCKTVSSAGHRRGAQMGVLRVDHPDIEAFVHAKQNETELTAFNISVGVTDEFMHAVIKKELFPLRFEGEVMSQVYAPALWEQIMRSTWDWAEPGVLFIDRINQANNLYYCEEIEATNPCGEQPLPPNGACLLGSWNLVKYVDFDDAGTRSFNFAQLMQDIPTVVRAMDNIHDNTVFPLEAQAEESRLKRRMGLGVTGLANAIEALGFPYGSPKFLEVAEHIFEVIRNETYRASVALAKEKGAFPLYTEDYLEAEFIKTLPDTVIAGIKEHGIRNSHLLSFAPTGTISLTADNVSGGIEPVFSLSYDRTIQTEEGPIVEEVKDYAYREWDIRGRTSGECTADEHLSVLALATKYVDSAVSKTVNVSPDMPWDEFKDIYVKAWKMGCKGITTFNSGGKRFGILNEKKIEEPEEDNGEAKACFIDPNTGQKECS